MRRIRSLRSSWGNPARFCGILAGLLLAACGGSHTVTAPPPPVGSLHDPEIWFHFDSTAKDSLGVYHVKPPYPDTALMRWYRGTPVMPRNPAQLLAQVKITGDEAVCAYFLVPATLDSMYIDIAWINHVTGDTTNPLTTLGPAMNSQDHPDWDGPYWDVGLLEDTTAGSYGMSGASNHTTSYCPAGQPRDSIAS
jgi:hypothetical protein